MGIANYVRNGRRFGDRKCSLGAKIPKMSLQAYDSSWLAASSAAQARSRERSSQRLKLGLLLVSL